MSTGLDGPAAKASGTPVAIGKMGDNVRLERVSLAAGYYNDAWLQQLVFDHPDILPIAQIEPGFGEIVAVAREVPCRHGYIDNLYVTGTGDLVLVEAKLWRNPQARREVVAQALGRPVGVRGTSYAAPLVAARAAAALGARSAVISALDREARDLGAPGPDPAFGRGLLCGTCRRTR